MPRKVQRSGSWLQHPRFTKLIYDETLVLRLGFGNRCRSLQLQPVAYVGHSESFVAPTGDSLAAEAIGSGLFRSAKLNDQDSMAGRAASYRVRF